MPMANELLFSVNQMMVLHGLTVRNFKTKFPKDRWVTGSQSNANSEEMATGPSNDCSDTRTSGSSSPSVESDGQN